MMSKVKKVKNINKISLMKYKIKKINLYIKKLKY